MSKCCGGHRRRGCSFACNTFVAGTNGCSSFNNVLVDCGFRHHDCKGAKRGCGDDRRDRHHRH